MRVFFGKADLALVHGYGHALAVEMNPQLGHVLRKLAEYPVRSLFFAFYSIKVDKALRQRTVRVTPTLHTYPRGRQLLDIFKIDHLEIAQSRRSATGHRPGARLSVLAGPGRTQGEAQMKTLLACLVCLLALLGTSARGADALNMGFYLPGIRDANLTDVKVTLKLWAEEVGKIYDIDATASTYDDMASLRRDMLSGAINMVVAPGMEIAETFDADELAEGFNGRHRGTGEGLALIVRAAGDIREFSHLRGRNVLRLANDRLSSVFLESRCRELARQACADFPAHRRRKAQQPCHTQGVLRSGGCRPGEPERAACRRRIEPAGAPAICASCSTGKPRLVLRHDVGPDAA
jgi:hypothetical protein